MTTGDRIREFCIQHGLTQAEVNYLLGVVGEAVLVEREACARAVEGLAAVSRLHPWTAGDAAAAIRARKET